MTDFVELNQAGLCAIDSHEYMKAVRSYRSAMESLNEERKSIRHRPQTPLDGVPRVPAVFRALAIPLELDECVGSYFTDSTASQDGQFVLYDVAFLIDFQDLVYAYPFVATTILYNMALAVHLDGLEHPNHLRLQRAKRMYETALNYFTSTAKRCVLQHTRTRECRLLFFAIANNHGHCCALLSDADGTLRAQRMLEHLLSDPYSLEDLGKQDERFFRMSIIIGTLRNNTSSLPPAA